MIDWLFRPPVLFPDLWLTVGVIAGAGVAVYALIRTGIDLIREYRRKQ